MTSCVGCGADVHPSWVFCPGCGRALRQAPEPVADPVVEDERSVSQQATVQPTGRRGAARLRLLAAAFMLAAAGVSVWALFPEYYDGGTSLRENGSLSYNLPVIGAWAVAGFLLLFRRTAVIGAAAAVGATGVWWAAYISDVGAVTTGLDTAGTGFLVDIAALGAAIAGSVASIVVLWREARPRFSAEGGAALWAPLAAITAIAYAAGTLMAWVRTTWRIQTDAPGVLWTSTGTREKHLDCCTLLDLPGWEQAESILLLLSIATIIVVAMALRPPRPAALAAVSAAVVMLAAPLYSVVRLDKEIPPSSCATQAGGQSCQVLGSTSGLPGLWIAFLAAGVVVVLAIGRVAQATTKRPS
jgi:hypothetical protein